MPVSLKIDGQPDDDTRNQEPPRSLQDPVFRPPQTFRSTSALATMASSEQSPSQQSHYLELAESTFTPLSMDSSEVYLSDSTQSREGGRIAQKLSAEAETDWLLRRARSAEHLRGSASASVSPAPAGSTILRGPASTVSAMVQSFEALHAANAARKYELLSAKSHGHPPGGVVSPPSTISPSPSTTPSGEHHVVAGAPGATAGPDAASQIKLTAAPVTADTDPSVPDLSPFRAHDDSSGLSLSATSEPAPFLSVAATDSTLIRLTPTTASPQTLNPAIPSPTQSLIVRTSSAASLTLSHPAPDVNKRSQAGGFLGNIAALEASAERLSMTHSIERAIREENDELKRSESRRSSVLQATRARATSASDSASAFGQSQLSRHNSILEINSAARIGGYSPGGYIMSPNNSMSAASTRLRSGSKASSVGMPPSIPGHPDPIDSDSAQEARFLPRHGPGKASTRSVASKLSIVQIAELDLPTGLTKEAFEEADRAAAAGADPVDEDAIRASAHQFIEAEFADEVDVLQPMLAQPAADEQAGRLHLHQPDQYLHYRPQGSNDERPTSSGSGTTYDQAQAAFGDFDGVHCDPEASDLPTPETQALPESQHQPQTTLPPRPTSYFDPTTRQQMLYYPAPVPAMLNLPPKLSKKPKKAAAAKDTRRSQILSAMPPAARESRVWLPDPLEGLRDGPDEDHFLGETGSEEQPPSHARQASEASTIQPPSPAPQPPEIRKPPRLTVGDNRKSRLGPIDGAPPQLRASAFFELPSAPVKIEMKGGSAMDTLDSILDASAAAPVNAFTDHAFAGKLGAEVYGPEKKKKVKKTAPTSAPAPTVEPKSPSGPKKLVKRNSSANLLEPPTPGHKKRASHFSLFGGKRDAAEASDSDVDETRSGLAGMQDDPRSHDGQASPNQLAPGSDEGSEEEEAEEEGEELYQGPPTTLLAELQLRKQQNKMRTRPLTHVYPNGMHSTLLELDAVAEVERKVRKTKRVNLAWEDPNSIPVRPEDEDDDDVPLGMLYVQKATGNRSTMDISALMSEVNRPLGLLERRELEDNEPLSRRRDRLQGKESTQSPLSLEVMQKRLSHMPLTSPGTGPAASGLRSQSRLTLPLHSGGRSVGGSVPGSVSGQDQPEAEDSEPEIEGETLAARKARLAAENPLPRARPVSGVFSAELLSQFGGADDEPSQTDGKAKSTAGGAHSRSTSADWGKQGKPPALDVPVAEEEETLGQRRRRLQLEREAREREMAAGARTATPLDPLNAASRPPLSRPLSMADVLTVHPVDQNAVSLHLHPAEQERLRREAEAARAQKEKEIKMAMLRAQMPTSLPVTTVGARTGGYMGGRFNDGLGGAGPMAAGSSLSLGYGGGMAQMGVGVQQQRASTLLGTGHLAGGPYGAGPGYASSSPNVNMLPVGMPAGVAYDARGMPMNMNGGGNDMVERWRQGVLP